ncbi:MAG: hypothetical protein Hens3KO_17820 [Henriciella sp.]
MPFYKTYPPLLLGLILVISLVSGLQFLAGPELEDTMLRTGALLDADQFRGIKQPLGPYASYVLHIFLHGGLWHLGMNMWALATFGKPAVQVLGSGIRSSLVFLAFFAFCAIGGAAAQAIEFRFTDGGFMLGASTAISGLIPAVGWLIGGWKRAIKISLPWFLINVALAFAGDMLPIQLSWSGHLGGLAAGFAFPFFLVLARRR